MLLYYIFLLILNIYFLYFSLLLYITVCVSSVFLFLHNIRTYNSVDKSIPICGFSQTLDAHKRRLLDKQKELY